MRRRHTIPIDDSELLPGSVLVAYLGHPLHRSRVQRICTDSACSASGVRRAFEAGERFSFSATPSAFADVTDVVGAVLQYLPARDLQHASSTCSAWRRLSHPLLCRADVAKSGAATCGRLLLGAAAVQPGRKALRRLTGALGDSSGSRQTAVRLCPVFGPFAGTKLTFTRMPRGLWVPQCIQHPVGEPFQGGTVFALRQQDGTAPVARDAKSIPRPVIRKLVALLHWNPLVGSVESAAARAGMFKLSGADHCPLQRSVPVPEPVFTSQVVVRDRCGETSHVLHVAPSACAAEVSWAVRERCIKWVPGTPPPPLLLLVNGAVLKDDDAVPGDVDVVLPVLCRPSRSFVSCDVLVLDTGHARVCFPIGGTFDDLARVVRSAFPAHAGKPQLLLQSRPGVVAELRRGDDLLSHRTRSANDLLAVLVCDGALTIKLQGMTSTAAVSVPMSPEWRVGTLLSVAMAACTRLNTEWLGPPSWCENVCAEVKPPPASALRQSICTVGADGAAGPVLDAGLRLRECGVAAGCTLLIHVDEDGDGDSCDLD
eukprot:TRINITY_DN15332_c0_g1_i3.p1 TRINITY_DN15332_c0_g1~~TRINITY_DN15332_c0_g1_i3.p1  ORF type:complete len:541 (+),score=125.84 TRINITY_DN15332_c0_g1_i3:46-1668(+)